MSDFCVNKVYLSDCIDSMKKMPSNSVDVAIADPPYNLSKGGVWKWDNSTSLPGFGGDWSKVMAEWDNMKFADYFNFTLSWLSEIKRVVRPTGSLWVHGTYHNIGIINFAMQILEIEIINEVVWFKRNSFPNLSGRRLTASHETILWAHTGTPKSRSYFFAYEKSKEMECPGDLIKKQGKQMRTVWDIPNNKKREEIKYGKHPTQKPIKLINRMLKISSNKGDTLLVPFAGSGSDCVAAKELGINFIAFDNDPNYVDICNARLSAIQSHIQLSLHGDKNSNEMTYIKLKKKTYNKPRKAKTIPSLIKWTGSKRSQANAIAGLIPEYKRFIEPFLGGGALLYLAAYPGSIAGDIYKPLIDLWKMIQKDHKAIIEDYEKKWSRLNDELNSIDTALLKRGHGLPKYFYKIRDNFNSSNNPLDLNFLMRTCVNGIVRFNKEGQFNNSFHLSRHGMKPERFSKIVNSWQKIIYDVNFYCQDYLQTMQMAEKGDFVYCDPPYAGNKQRYIENLDLNQFYNALADLNRRRVSWALSFDGKRGEKFLVCDVPKSLYKRQIFLKSGNSSVNKVLNNSVEVVEESLYLNY